MGLCGALRGSAGKQTAGEQEWKHSPLGGYYGNPLEGDILLLVGMLCGTQIESVLITRKSHSSHQQCLQGRRQTLRLGVSPKQSLHHLLYKKGIWLKHLE